MSVINYFPDEQTGQTKAYLLDLNKTCDRKMADDNHSEKTIAQQSSLNKNKSVQDSADLPANAE
jgi:hypothetical protein